MNIRKEANDPLQIQQKVSFDDESLRINLQSRSGRKRRPIYLVGDDQEDENKMANEEVVTNTIDHEGTKVDRITTVKLREERTDLGESTTVKSRKEEKSDTTNVESRKEEKSDVDGIVNPNDEDILSGRGNGVSLHPGNVFYLKLVQSHKEQYANADPGEKKCILKRIVKKSNQHGCFLKHDPITGLWERVTFKDVIRKFGQAIRETAHDIKKQQLQQNAMLEAKNVGQTQQHTIQDNNPVINAHQQLEIKDVGEVVENDPAISKQQKAVQDNSLLIKTQQKECLLTDETNTMSNNSNSSESEFIPPLTISSPASMLKRQFSSQSLSQRPPQFKNQYTTISRLLWSQMNILHQKQEQMKRNRSELDDEFYQLMQKQCQLKRKQTELEDEQNEMLRYFYQTAISKHNRPLGGMLEKTSYENSPRKLKK